MRYLLPLQVFGLLIVSVIFSACESADTSSSYDLVGTWKVEAYTDHYSKDKVTKSTENTWEQFNNGDATIVFKPTGIGQGEVQGVNVANIYYGRYNQTKSGVIALTDMSWSEVGEPEWGRRFHSIADAESFEKVSDDVLKIYYNGGSNSITLRRLK